MLGGVKVEAEVRVEAVEGAGLSVEEWHQEDRSSHPNEKPTGHSGVFVIVARKTENITPVQ